LEHLKIYPTISPLVRERVRDRTGYLNIHSKECSVRAPTLGHHHAATGSGHTHHFLECAHRVVHVLENRCRTGSVEAVIGEIKMVGVPYLEREGQAGAGDAFGRRGDEGGAEVDPGDAAGWRHRCRYHTRASSKSAANTP
jgi:hypothetical protein